MLLGVQPRKCQANRRCRPSRGAWPAPYAVCLDDDDEIRVQAEDTNALLKEIRSHYIPDRVLLYADGGEGQQFLSAHHRTIAGT